MYLYIFYFKWSHLQAAEPCNTIGRYTIMVEEIPLTLILCYAVVGCPSYDRLKQFVLKSEWSIRIVSDSVTQQMAIARAVREIVLAVHLVHP